MTKEEITKYLQSMKVWSADNGLTDDNLEKNRAIDYCISLIENYEN